MAKLGAFLHNVIVQLPSHLDVLYIVEFSFRSNGSQWRSTCVFGVYIQVSLREFLGVHIIQGTKSFKHL